MRSGSSPSRFASRSVSTTASWTTSRQRPAEMRSSIASNERSLRGRAKRRRYRRVLSRRGGLPASPPQEPQLFVVADVAVVPDRGLMIGSRWATRSSSETVWSSHRVLSLASASFLARASLVSPCFVSTSSHPPAGRCGPSNPLRHRRPRNLPTCPVSRCDTLRPGWR